MDQELYDLVYLLDQLARAAGAYDGSPLQARVRRALNAGEEELYGGKLVQVVLGDGLRIGDPVTKLPAENDVPHEYRCDSCHESQRCQEREE